MLHYYKCITHLILYYDMYPWQPVGLANVKEGVSLEITRCLDQEGGAGL